MTFNQLIIWVRKANLFQTQVLIQMKKTILIVAMIFMANAIIGCGQTVIPYKPYEAMNIKDATEIVNDLIMKQHRNWRPANFEIRDEYFYWNYRHKGAEKFYYKDLYNVRLTKWKRKFKTWYVVSVLGNPGIRVLYTRYYADAKSFANALETILIAQKDKLGMISN